MIRSLLIRWAQSRKPDFVIGGQDDPYLLRWFLIPRNPLFNVYVHKFLRSDDDRAAHGHPWLFNSSWLLNGPYIEWVPSNGNTQRLLPEFRQAGDWKFRWGAAPHRIQLHHQAGRNIPCWTLFITGPRVRDWGFYCPQGWRHWREFTDSRDSGAIGKGCAE